MPTSCSHYFAETIRSAQRAGIDPDLLLANVGLTREQVFNPSWRGDVEKLAQLVQLVWFALDDEFMGFLAKPSKRGTFAMMTHCIIHSHSLESALRKGILFYKLFTDALQMSLEIKDGEGCFTVSFRRPELDPAHYFIEFWMMIWYRLVGWLGGGLPPLTRVTFSYPCPTEYSEEFKHVFRCPHIFDAPATSLYFDAKFLAQPVVRSRQELKRLLSLAPLDFMTVPADDTSTTRRIRTRLLAGRTLPLRFPSFSKLADQFKMTEQTLRRQLKRESTSYRTIKENIRRDIAIQKLMEGRMEVQEISFLLGYSEPRAFTRAFQQWTGLSPTQYRLNLQRQFHPQTARPAGTEE